MSDVEGRRGSRVRWGLWVGGLAVAGFAVLLVRSLQAPQGPVDIIWDKEACAHCHMHVGDRTMAAQAQLADGQVLNFDDPGCLLSWLREQRGALRAVFVRHHQQDRWLSREEAAFVEVPHSPMGFNLGAVDRGTAGAISWEQAAERVGAMAMGGDR